MNFEEKLAVIVEKHKGLGEKLSNPAELGSKDFAKISKEYSDLTPVVEKANEYIDSIESIEELTLMSEDEDLEMRKMAEDELDEIKKRLPVLEKEIQIALLPKDEADEKNAILEIRAGTGGDEAAIFAGNLLGMYHRYADRKGWKFEILTASDSEMGGYKDVQVAITGTNVFQRMKFESGVHRVQRVPNTETQGRVHTSAATVAVLPEAEDIDVQIEDKDLRIDVYRASGPGGQCVNTTDSAVRITHIPTGIVVAQQDEKSQHKNKAKGMRILKSRIYEHQRAEADAARSEQRKSQIGSGDRSERIRTYNYPQSRVSDHRINLTLYKIDEIVNSGDLDEIIDSLTAADQADRLSSAI